MVLGSSDRSPGTRSSSGGVGRGFFGTRQQPPHVHAYSFGQDCSGSHQHTNPVQGITLFIGLQFASSPHLVLFSQCSQLGAALHGAREARGGGEGECRGQVAIKSLSTTEHPGLLSGFKTQTARVQAPRPTLFAAPNTLGHKQTFGLPQTATTPRTPSPLHPGLSLQGMIAVSPCIHKMAQNFFTSADFLFIQKLKEKEGLCACF